MKPGERAVSKAAVPTLVTTTSLREDREVVKQNELAVGERMDAALLRLLDAFDRVLESFHEPREGPLSSSIGTGRRIRAARSGG